MAVREILLLGNSGLRKVAQEETEFRSELHEIARDLRETLHSLQSTYKTGNGLAATQIGINRRVVYIDTIDRKLILINPKIIWKSEETTMLWESCFSFLQSFYVKIRRHSSVQVKYQNYKREIIIEKFNGQIAEIVQHEIDHIDAILPTDLIENKQDIIMASEYLKKK